MARRIGTALIGVFMIVGASSCSAADVKSWFGEHGFPGMTDEQSTFIANFISSHAKPGNGSGTGEHHDAGGGLKKPCVPQTGDHHESSGAPTLHPTTTAPAAQHLEGGDVMGISTERPSCDTPGI